MCFSPEADLVVGATVTLIGVDALRHTDRRHEIPLAALPLAFGVHQLIEVGVWGGTEGWVSQSVGHAAVVAFLLIAFVLPVLVPAVVLTAEPDRRRRRLMGALLVVGTVPTVVLTRALVVGSVDATAADLHVSYDFDAPMGGALTVLYAVATCGSLMLSSFPRIARFGWLNLVAVALLVALINDGVISLWCAWAAVLSILIDLHVRRPSIDRSGGPPGVTRSMSGRDVTEGSEVGRRGGATF